MKIKTSELKGAALDWAVAKCDGYHVFLRKGKPACSKDGDEGFLTHYSTSWNAGGPIIEREKINFLVFSDGWYAGITTYNGEVEEQGTKGETPLIAAMRCYVTSELGNEVEIPEELV